MLRILLVLLVLMPTVSLAEGEYISVNGTKIFVPFPRGFGPVTEDMGTLYDVTKQVVPAGNTEFRSYMSEIELWAYEQGGAADMHRRFSIQIEDRLNRRSISPKQFSNWKLGLKEFIDSRAKDPKKTERKGTVSMHGSDFNYGTTTESLYPPHFESENMLAFSTRLRVQPYGMQGERATSTTVGLHLGGRILDLFAFGGADDLEWTRAEANAWAQAILEANPGLATSAGAIDGSAIPLSARIFRGAFLVALIGGVIGLFAKLFGRRDARKDETPPTW